MFLFTCILLEFCLFAYCVMVLAAQMCFYKLVSQTAKFYVSLRAFKIRTSVIASFNPRRQSEYGDKVISTTCVFQNIHRECFFTSFVLCCLLSSSFFFPSVFILYFFTSCYQQTVFPNFVPLCRDFMLYTGVLAI